jgi:hypothetical protein
MPVHRGDLTKVMGPRGRRAEYTRKCGWIDWAHADPDREDLKAIWSVLKSPPVRSDGGIDLSDRRVATVKGDNGQLYHYLRVKFSLDMGTALWLVSVIPVTDFTGYVLLDPNIITPYYWKRAALSLFFFACNTVEWHQSAPLTDLYSHSSYSMEDMVSNRMAFYQLVENVSADVLIERAGGWVNRDEALKNSTLVMDAIDRVDADTPKSPADWDYAYLFNDIADLDDKRGGWQSIPYYFTQQMGMFRTDQGPGTTVGLDFDEEESSASLGLGQKSEYLAHLRGHQPLTGPRSAGRKPGPLGLA